jgi:acyl carrier protein
MTETEAVVLEMWRALLPIEPVSAESEFFEHGGDSLAAVRFIARVQEEFGVDIVVEIPWTVGVAARAIEHEQINCLSREDLEALISEVDSLSDEEVASLLGTSAFEPDRDE